MYSMLNTYSMNRKLNVKYSQLSDFTGVNICKTTVKTWQPANLARQWRCLAWIVRKWPGYIHLGYNIIIWQKCRSADIQSVPCFISCFCFVQPHLQFKYNFPLWFCVFYLSYTFPLTKTNKIQWTWLNHKTRILTHYHRM